MVTIITYKKFFLRMLFIIMSLSVFSLQAISINYEQAHYSYPSTDFKIAEKTISSTRYDLKQTITLGRFLGAEYSKYTNAVKVAAKGGVQYTKSSLQLGQQMHKAYKVGDVVEGVAMKEFRRIPGIRPDFVYFSTKTIYELKPFNPRAMQQVWNQLNKYQNLFQQKYGGTWKTVLDTY